MPKNEVTETKLTSADKKALTKHEETIRSGLTSFIEVGHALAEIRDSQLYRENYKSFEDYCRDKWDIERRVAYNRIAAAAVVDVIRGVKNSSHVPLTESHALELSKAGEHAPKVWAAVVKNSPPLEDGSPCVTAKKIAEIRDAMLKPKADPPPPAQPQVPKDEPPRKDKATDSAVSKSPEPPPADEPPKPVNGFGTHEDLEPVDDLDEARKAFRSMAKRLDDKHTELKALAEEFAKFQGAGFKKLHGSGSITSRIDDAARSCKSAAANLRNATPATPAECTTCKGKAHGCKDCGADGWQSNEERRDADNRRAANAPRVARA